MSEATPRVLAAHLANFTNRTVRIVGRVAQVRGNTATLDAEGQVSVTLSPTTRPVPNSTAEIIAKVHDNLTVSALLCTDLGPNVDLAAYRAVVDATHRYPEIFYTAR